MNNGKEKKLEGKEYLSKSNANHKDSRCFCCNNIQHIKKNCHVNLKPNNVDKKESSSKEEDWEKYFVVETTSIGAMASINFEKGCKARLIYRRGFDEHHFLF